MVPWNDSSSLIVITEEEERNVISQALAASENDPWTPTCVVAAFLEEPGQVAGLDLQPLTMQGWLRLEKARSPFVSGSLPQDGEGRLQAICFALSVLTSAPVHPEYLMSRLTAEEVVAAELTISSRINAVFETSLPVRWPQNDNVPESRDHGLGWWIRVFTRLVSDLHIQPKAALETAVSQAFAMLAARNLMDGAVPKEMNWKEREFVERALAAAGVANV